MGITPESRLLADIRLELGRDDRVVLWRNNTGTAMQDYGAAGLRPLRYGLAVGSSDLIGIVAPSGRFIALEVKAPKGRVTREQEQWLELVRKMGGVARVVRSVDEALAAVSEACESTRVDLDGTETETSGNAAQERTQKRANR